MSPEYAWTGVFSEKSDTYSFGVLLLEVISGEKISRFSYDKERKNLLAYVSKTLDLEYWTYAEISQPVQKCFLLLYISCSETTTGVGILVRKWRSWFFG